jgi:hypothetical protein
MRLVFLARFVAWACGISACGSWLWRAAFASWHAAFASRHAACVMRLVFFGAFCSLGMRHSACGSWLWRAAFASWHAARLTWRGMRHSPRGMRHVARGLACCSLGVRRFRPLWLLVWAWRASVPVRIFLVLPPFRHVRLEGIFLKSGIKKRTTNPTHDDPRPEKFSKFHQATRKMKQTKIKVEERAEETATKEHTRDGQVQKRR